MIITTDDFWRMAPERVAAIREWVIEHRVPWCYVHTLQVDADVAAVRGYRANEEGYRYIDRRDDDLKQAYAAEWSRIFKVKRPLPS